MRYTGIFLLLAWSAAPTLWIIIASLQPESAVTSIPVSLTADLNFANYSAIFRSPEWLSSFQVSLEVTLGTTFATLLIASLAAYPLARLNLPGKNVIMGAPIFTYTIPAIVLAIPLLLLFNHLGLTDTVLGLIVANVAFSLPLAIWLLRNTFQSVPKALESSARMDGCTRPRHAVPSDAACSVGGGSSDGHPAHHQHLERIPVRGRARAPRSGNRHASHRLHRLGSWPDRNTARDLSGRRRRRGDAADARAGHPFPSSRAVGSDRQLYENMKTR